MSDKNSSPPGIGISELKFDQSWELKCTVCQVLTQTTPMFHCGSVPGLYLEPPSTVDELSTNLGTLVALTTLMTRLGNGASGDLTTPDSPHTRVYFIKGTAGYICHQCLLDYI